MDQVQESFEKQLVGSPDSSILWIKYMSKMLEMGDIGKAKALGERALRTINFRKEQEKMNIWIALLNLELHHGTSDSAASTFERSLVYMEPKQMYLKYAHVLRSAGRKEEAEEILRKASKKFRQSCKVWLALIEHLYGTSGATVEEVETLYRDAVKALPKRKHDKFNIRVARLEYQTGHVEHGRHRFETLVAVNPKRVDLWSVYLDMEQSKRKGVSTDVEHVRRVYERILSLKLSSKKAKYFFKRYLAFEKEHGTPNTINHVKDLARRYVESLNS